MDIASKFIFSHLRNTRRSLQKCSKPGGPHLLQLPGGPGNGIPGFTESKEFLTLRKWHFSANTILQEIVMRKDSTWSKEAVVLISGARSVCLNILSRNDWYYHILGQKCDNAMWEAGCPFYMARWIRRAFVLYLMNFTCNALHAYLSISPLVLPDVRSCFVCRLLSNVLSNILRNAIEYIKNEATRPARAGVDVYAYCSVGGRGGANSSTLSRADWGMLGVAVHKVISPSSLLCIVHIQQLPQFLRCSWGV